ncbi:MAG: 50S ribosome-binding GTPase, partial [Oscillospiraceae bacterium]|nr:50S ribosome-binding GTPase [Oscillospiraceae bacterium]
MKIGLIGLNQTGKTTVFDLLTGRENTAASGKTALHTGVGLVPDERIACLSALYRPQKTTYAQIEFTDVAGFSAGDGRKSAAARFLSEVRHCDALVHILRAFESETLPPERGRIDPAADLDALETELLLADLVMLERRIERVKSGKKIAKEQAEELARLERCFACLEGGGSVLDLGLPESD